MTSNNLKGIPSVTVLGYFDGVHIGHRELIKRGRELADKMGLPLCVWTFDGAQGRALLTPTPLRVGWLKELGADIVSLCDFDSVRDLSPEDFAEGILRDELCSALCVCGFNYKFGRGASANSDELARLCLKNGIKTEVVGEKKVFFDGDDVTVSSTLIRKIAEERGITSVYSFLGHHFATCGEVLRGRGYARTVGMPTLNQLPQKSCLLPSDGVYATYCRIEDSYYPSVTAVGVRPTFFDGGMRVLETHIIGFEGDLYGKNIPIGYLKKLRDEKKFEGKDEFAAQINRDAESARLIFSENCGDLLLPRL